jgi:anti-anti-sigma factor
LTAPPAPGMLERENVYTSVVMIFSNEYDIACKEELRRDLARLSDVPNVVLDFTDVTYIDSTALGEFIRMHNARTAKGYARETIVVTNLGLKRLFDLVHLHEVFRFVTDLGDAVPSGESTGLYYASAGCAP